jgi:hypothetical protein
MMRIKVHIPRAHILVQPPPLHTPCPRTSIFWSPCWWQSLQHFEFLELLDAVLVDGGDHVQDLKTLLLQDLEEGCVLNGGTALSGNVAKGGREEG